MVFNKYEVEKKEAYDGGVEVETSFPILAKWVWDDVWEQQHMGMAMEDPYVDTLSCPPSTKALRYQRMKAYGNHFQLNDCNTKGMLVLIARWRQCLANDKHTLVMNMHQYNILGSLRTY